MEPYKPVIFDQRLLEAMLLAPLAFGFLFALPLGDFAVSAGFTVPVIAYPLILLFGLPYHIAMRKNWNDSITSYLFAGFLFGFFGMFFVTDSQYGHGLVTLLTGGIYGAGVAGIARFIAGPIAYSEE